MEKLPPDVFVAVFSTAHLKDFTNQNDEVVLGKKIIREHRTRAVRIIGWKNQRRYIKEIPIGDWDFYIKTHIVRILGKSEFQGFMDAIQDVYHYGLTGEERK